MLKKILIVAVICLGAVGVSVAFTVGYRNVSYELPRERMKKVKQPYFGQNKHTSVLFQNMTFPTGKSVQGLDPTITEFDTCLDPKLNGYFQHLRERDNWLRSLDDIHMSANVESATLQTKGKRQRAQNFHIFGVMAVEVTDSQGKKKLWATETVRMNEVHDGPSDKPIAYPKKQVARREDFVNPEDVDWLFGVSDFSKYGVVKGEVRLNLFQQFLQQIQILL